MATFKEITANSIYRVSGDAWSTNWGNYPSGYYMTLDAMEAITTPLRNKRTVWQTNEDGEFVRDEDGDRIAVLDDDGNEVKEFEYNRNSKKGSIWMIRIPDAEIKTVGIYETQTIVYDEDFWDDPNVPEYYDKEVRIGTKLNREVGERPEIDLDDLHLVQTRHIDWCRGDSLEQFYASADEDYLREQADKSASALAQATNKRKVSELSEDTWDLFLNIKGEKLFDPEKYRGESNRGRYTKGEAHDGGRYDYRPRISYGTLYAVDKLMKELKDAKEDVERYRELWQEAKKQGE